MKQIYAIEYKAGNAPKEAVRCEASTLVAAEAAGRKWCQAQSNGLKAFRFISVKPFIEFDADEYLGGLPPEPQEPVKEQVSQKDQAKRLAERPPSAFSKLRDVLTGSGPLDAPEAT